jgi:hypothetical protein
MAGYKNAPHITPQVGDVVKFEGGTENIEVTSVGNLTPPEPGSDSIQFTNCRFKNTGLPDVFHLNQPETMILVRTIDGIEPQNHD